MPLITGKLIPLDARLVLQDILVAAGVNSCEITSVARTPEQQGAVMFDNLIGVGPQQGVQHELDLYKDPGDVVIGVFVANRQKPRAEIIALMAAKIRELGPGTVSHHCCDPSKITVFDVGPHSITPQSARPAFESAAKDAQLGGKILKFLSPQTSDPAYHFEIAVKP